MEAAFKSAVPDAQLRNTLFAARIVPLDISRMDPYSTKGKDVAFNKFIKRLEGIETRFAQRALEAHTLKR